MTLSIVDNEDGTTATATITGTLGDTVSVYTGRVNGQLGAVPMTLAGSRVGDGNLTLTLSRGYFFAYAITPSQARSDLTYFKVTDGQDAVATRIRAGVVATMKLVPIPCCVNIYEQMFPDESNVSYPCIVCTVDGVQETDESSLSTVDDFGRPVKVLIADRVDKYDHEQLPNYENWRQALIRCFVNQQIPGVPESVRCKIEPYVIIDPNLPQFQHMVSGFVIRAVTREPRGVGV